ncbi:purine-binding chemotaxis protein CheW [Sporobacter termitidis DSM 10068]|uniref:Purine-binding chemotaxis protein CheW n=1 Tax=Sporobacter termitidis DSM 10068 TaxID=1123282 RepID=A0A1M5W9U5_9FIRM|nr:chemotaxis protein CheW [Sporobacter termitidis]SHH84208.1 purine-binding chemotaxis protein CheW [Sporobacter termitidis DSM 10068]
MSEIATTTEIIEDAQKGRFLDFLVGNESFGIEIKYVTEIIGIQSITEMPEMPSYVKGIINLRGRIIPLIDVRLRFGKEPKPYDDRTCVIVVGINGFSYGLIVDSVSEVLTIPDEEISPLPGINTSTGNKFVKNIGKTANGIVLVVDCEKLLTADEIGELSI